MSSYSGLLLALSLLLGGCGLPGGGATGNPALSLEVIPNWGPWDNDEIHLSQPGDHFHVVLINTSQESHRIWKEWSSWGYFCLSFEVIDSSGNIAKVSRKSRAWIANSPDFVTLGPGEHVVFNVSLDPAEWENTPLPSRGEIKHVKISATYEIRASREAEEIGVWVGRVSSNERSYKIVRDPL